MRITRTEEGSLYGKYYVRPYKRTYTQPLHNFLVSRLYHRIWERCTWRIYRYLENLRERFSKPRGLWIPYTNRQDIRCDHLHRKGQIELSMEIGQPEKPHFHPRDIDMLHIALGTFLQDHPDFWNGKGLTSAEALYDALSNLVYGVRDEPKIGEDNAGASRNAERKTLRGED